MGYITPYSNMSFSTIYSSFGLCFHSCFLGETGRTDKLYPDTGPSRRRCLNPQSTNEMLLLLQSYHEMRISWFTR